MDEYSAGFCTRGGRGSGAGTKCGRWNPTSEQVKVLTELFRSGLRTPSTEQIQKISSELSFYGKIESKNVFYWFQNHKARERQKRRRVLVHDSAHPDITTNSMHTTNPLSTKQFGGPEINQVLERERVVETLQLFPLNSADSDKIKLFADHDHCKPNTTFSYMEMDHATLDLRLSFV